MKTPMSRMQDHFKKLNSLVRPLFNEVTLNQKRSRYNPYINDGLGGKTKAVESDFIRIYKPSTNCKSMHTSFAFAFNKIKHVPENVLVTVSIKKNQNFETINLDFNQFKENFNTYLKMLEGLQKNKKLNEDSVIKTLKSVFPVKNDPSAPDYLNILQTMQENLSESLSKFEELRLELDKKELALNKIMTKIDAKVDKFRKELEIQHNIPVVKKQNTKLFSDVVRLNTKLNEEIDEIINDVVVNNSSISVHRIKENLKNELVNKTTKKHKFKGVFVNVVLDKLTD